MKRRTQPDQPVYWDQEGVIRFRQNAVVRYLYDWAARHGHTLNDLAMIPFPARDMEQFYQLLGTSVTTYGDVFGRAHAVRRATAAADALRAATGRRKAKV